MKAEAERIRLAAEKNLEERKEKIAASFEPVPQIRADLIGMQNELITMLYNEETASTEMKKLK